MLQIQNVLNMRFAWFLLINSSWVMPFFLAGLIIGASYIADCPTESRIPVWSVVLGTVGLAMHLSIISSVSHLRCTISIDALILFLLPCSAVHCYSKKTQRKGCLHKAINHRLCSIHIVNTISLHMGYCCE